MVCPSQWKDPAGLSCPSMTVKMGHVTCRMWPRSLVGGVNKTRVHKNQTVRNIVAFSEMTSDHSSAHFRSLRDFSEVQRAAHS